MDRTDQRGGRWGLGGMPVATVALLALTGAVSIAHVAAEFRDLGDVRAALATLACGPEALAAGRWPVLVTHAFLHAHPLHLVFALVLLAPGALALERRRGGLALLGIFGASAALTGAAAVAFAGSVVSGALGPALTILTAAVADPYVGAARPGARLGAVLGAVGLTLALAALLGDGSGVSEWALAGVPLGVGIAWAGPVSREIRWRRYVAAGLRDLADEPRVREQVEALLERIAREGARALTRTERRFLKHSARFFVPGRHRDRVRDGEPVPRADLPAGWPPGE